AGAGHPGGVRGPRHGDGQGRGVPDGARTVDDRPAGASPPVTKYDRVDSACEHADVTEFSTVEFAAFYTSEMRPLIRHVMRAVPGADMHQAADAAQSAFMQAYQTWSTIRHPRAWLRTVAVREYHRVRTLEA